jgi:heptaprenyl diphosphate synthase
VKDNAESRLLRRKRWSRFFSSRDLCAAGLLVLPALLFNPEVGGRAAQFLLFSLFLWLSGGRPRLPNAILIILSITLVNLLVPYGRVLLSLGPLRITAGALRTGLGRGLTLEALIMLSRSSVRPDLKLPGLFGELLGESFRIFSFLTEKKRLVNPKDICGSIDELLLELSAGSAGEGETALYAKTTSLRGRIILAAVVLLSWLPAAIPFALARYS